MNENFLEEEIISGFKVTTERKKIWAAEIEILEEFIKVCNELELHYFVGAGTFLGAVRHQGFIPWDDDIDVYLLREDYDKFQKLAPKLFKGKFFLQNHLTDKGYFRTHAQLRNSETTAILESEKDKQYSFNQGIFIDIFPFDGVPNDIKKRKKIFKKLDIIKYIIVLNNLYEKNKRNKLSFTIAHLVVSVVGYKKLLNKYQKICAKYSKKEYNLIGNLALFSSKVCLFDKKLLEEFGEYKFEYISVTGPKNYDEYLKTEYGDYMKLIKGSNEHGGIIFDTEIDYKKYLQKARENETTKH